MKRLFNSKKSILLLLAALAAAHWGVNYLFNVKENQPPLGFCEEKNRVLTYEEIILAALESKYRNNSIKTDDSTKTAQDFYKKYPFCCGFGPPSASYPRRNPLTGKLYIKDPGYVVATLYYPTSDELMKTPTTICDGGPCIEVIPSEKNLNYTTSRIPVINCGGVGSSVDIASNIKDTPFGNDFMRSPYDSHKSRRDWRTIFRAQVWESEEHYKAGDKDWQYSEQARF